MEIESLQKAKALEEQIKDIKDDVLTISRALSHKNEYDGKNPIKRFILGLGELGSKDSEIIGGCISFSRKLSISRDEMEAVLKIKEEKINNLIEQIKNL